MRLRAMALDKFRNFPELHAEFPANLNIFVGNNAQGKTNLLEAIYLLATSRSFRTNKDSELINWEADRARIRIELERFSGTTTLEARLQHGTRKQFYVNENPLSRIVDLLGYLNVVAFTPDDLQMVKGSPSLRRQFLNMEICQVSKVYRQDLAKYNQVLAHRNKLLKEMLESGGNRRMLEVWDEQLIDYGARIVAKRAAAVTELSRWGEIMHRSVTSDQEKLTISYEPFFAAGGQTAESQTGSLVTWQDKEKVKEMFRAELAKRRADEFRRGLTLVGPQRDDLSFSINGVDVRSYGSQGQQRSTVLSCKLAEIEFMRSVTGQYPVLLLDDVMSELDDYRRSFLMKTVAEKIQTFLTTTSLAGIDRAILAEADIYEICAGRLTGKQEVDAG